MQDEPYKVGYGKPPREHQFKPKQSGNPGGRKKGSRGLKTDLLDELEAKETIKIGDNLVTDTRQRQAVRTLAIRAAKGDLKAQQQFFPLILQLIGPEDRNTKKDQLSSSDQALLDEVLQSYVDRDTTSACAIDDTMLRSDDGVAGD